MKKFLFLGSVLGLSLLNAQNLYSYGFDADFGADWTLTNQSGPFTDYVWEKAAFPPGVSIFGSSAANPPPGQAGGGNSFSLIFTRQSLGFGANGTVSNWLISPAVTVKDGDKVSFYTRKGNSVNDLPDRLELRYSTAAATIVPSGGSNDVGSFTTLGVPVNPNLVTGYVYPATWTKYSFTITGVGAVPVSAKFGFRYFITNAGLGQPNGDVIGIDTFSVDRGGTLAVNDTEGGKKGIKVYPIPVSEVLTIKSDSKISNAEIFDLSGRKLPVHFNGEKADVRSLQPGTYLISIETKEGKTTEKFIKK